MNNDIAISQSEELIRLEQSAKIMIEKIGQLVLIVQDKKLSAMSALKVLDVFIQNITAEFNVQNEATKALLKKYVDFCHSARALIVQVKNTQN